MKYKPDELEEKYKNIYVEMLDKLEKTGVSMSIANTRNDMKKYIEYLISQNADSKLIVSVDIRPNDEYNYFRSAKSGTIKNPNGVNGSCYVKIDIKNKSPLLNDLGGISTGDVWGDYHVIPIKAIKYSSGSSNSSSSSGSSDSDNSENEYYGKNYFHTTGGNLMSGTWVRQGGKWKLRTESGSYARSQWANLDNKWYLLGPDSYMRTGWQMVNNQWYLLDSDGVMLTGWYTDGTKKYWLAPSGEMATGWKWIEDKWYYMDSTGAMMVNANTPDGYRVNENGEWIQ